MDQVTLFALLAIVLVIALLAVKRGFQSWLIRLFGIESHLNGFSTHTEIKARKSSIVRKILNRFGFVKIDADESTVEDVKNEYRQ